MEGLNAVTAAELEEAVELTVGGLATVFVLLILLVLLLVVLRWVLSREPVRRRLNEQPSPASDPDRRNKALASAIGVTIALAEAGVSGRVEMVEEVSA